jgi:tetratricopeptide (TPR) repeat protein
MLTDYIAEVDLNIGSNPADSIHSILASFPQNEYSLDLADGYNRFAVYSKNKQAYVDAIKSFQQEILIRQHLTPEDAFNSLFSNLVSTYADMIKPVSKSYYADMDVAVQHYSDLSGPQPTINLLLDIQKKLSSLGLFNQAKDCLNRALVVYNKLNIHDPEQKYLIYHPFIAVNNSLMEADLRNHTLNSPTFGFMDTYVKELTDEQAMVEICNSGLTVLFSLHPIKCIEFMLKAAVISHDANKPKSTYFDFFENVYGVIRANPTFLQGSDHHSSFESVTDYETVFGKFYRFADGKNFILNKSPAYPVTSIDMFHFVAGKFLALNDTDNAEMCIRAATVMIDYGIPDDKHNEPICKQIDLENFNLRKKLCYQRENYSQVLSMIRLKASFDQWAVVEISDQDCMVELSHLGERCLSQTPSPNFLDGLEAFREAMNLCKKLYPGNNSTMAGLLHDMALSYEDYYQHTKDKDVKNMAAQCETQYEQMMQCINQGIL